MPKKETKTETETSEAAQPVDYAKFTARLGDIQGVLKQAPNARIQMAVDDVYHAIEAKRDEKMMAQVILAVKTQIELQGEPAKIYADAMPQRLRSSDPKAQAHYTRIENELNALMDAHAPLLEVMFNLKIGVRLKQGDEYTLEDYRETLQNKNKAVNKYNKLTSTTAQPTEDSSEAWSPLPHELNP